MFLSEEKRREERNLRCCDVGERQDEEWNGRLLCCILVSIERRSYPSCWCCVLEWCCCLNSTGRGDELSRQKRQTSSGRGSDGDLFPFLFFFTFPFLPLSLFPLFCFTLSPILDSCCTFQKNLHLFVSIPFFIALTFHFIHSHICV